MSKALNNFDQTATSPGGEKILKVFWGVGQRMADPPWYRGIKINGETMKRRPKKRSRGVQAQELKFLFHRSANWRQSFVPLNPALRLDLGALGRDPVQGLIKAPLTKAARRRIKASQANSRLNKVRQASKKNRQSRLDTKPSGRKHNCE
jgi:hypothetical protein